jgi:hypothetical protein
MVVTGGIQILTERKICTSAEGSNEREERVSKVTRDLGASISIFVL